MLFRKKISLIYALCCLSFNAFAASESITVTLNSTTEPNSTIGTITFSNSEYGLMISPNLSKLSPGAHGLHIHENPSCDNAGMSAGGHYDPQHTKSHLGPYQQGHLGDLPVLIVDQDGSATTPSIAPRLKLQDIKGRAIMIHEGGDNYSDKPKKLGGGGARVACGVIK